VLIAVALLFTSTPLALFAAAHEPPVIGFVVPGG
jgi:hypothetical protein